MAETITAAPGVVTIKNIYNPDAVNAVDLPKDILAADDVFNTGMSAIGDPHSDEVDSVTGLSNNTGKTIVKDPEAWEAKHIASIRLYRTNSYVYLAPDDSIKLTTKSGAETAYYMTQKISDFVSVEFAPENSGSDVEPAPGP